MLQYQRREANLNFIPSGNRSARRPGLHREAQLRSPAVGGGGGNVWHAICRFGTLCTLGFFAGKSGNESRAQRSIGPIPEQPSYPAIPNPRNPISQLPQARK